MVDLAVRIGGLQLANPVLPASGTFGPELAEVIDLARLGALVTKSVTPDPREGNPTPRLCETEAGILNSIGIPGKGLDHFLAVAVPEWRRFGPPVVASLSAPTIDAFASAAARLAGTPGIAAVEVNISCPNLEADGRAFAQDPEPAAAVIAAMRAAAPALPLWAKLSPNTGDIAAVARAVEAAGADALVVANTILGLAIDIERARPRLGAGLGGFSGPAFKPIALRLVWQCAAAVDLPIVGVGGIATAEDAIEFMMAGATAVQVGTATFVHPGAMLAVLDGIEAFCARRGFAHARDLTGLARTNFAAPLAAAPLAAE